MITLVVITFLIGIAVGYVITNMCWKEYFDAYKASAVYEILRKINDKDKV
jgi:hypothetical protein